MIERCGFLLFDGKQGRDTINITCYPGGMMGNFRMSTWNDLLYCDDHMQDTQSLVLKVLIRVKWQLHLASSQINTAYDVCACTKSLDNIDITAHFS